MKQLKQTAVFILMVIIFQQCHNPNDRIYAQVEHQFEDSVKKYDAEEFHFTYDVLSPQTSFFINSKLKFLTLKSSGEFCDSERKYMFAVHGDLVIWTAERVVCNGYEGMQGKSDTVRVVDYLSNLETNYADGKKVSTKKIEDVLDRSYLDQIIRETEKAYNSK